MREDFDYVSMENYSADMRELSDTAAAALQFACKERDKWKMLFWAAVRASDGKLEIPDFFMQLGVPEEYEIHECVDRASRIYTVGGL